jgi:hypothetical protein
VKSNFLNISLYICIHRSSIPTFVSGHCSVYSAWGNATIGGKTLKLRALDWDTESGAQDFPVITIYHPLSSKLGHAFANVAWAGTELIIYSQSHIIIVEKKYTNSVYDMYAYN